MPTKSIPSANNQLEVKGLRSVRSDRVLFDTLDFKLNSCEALFVEGSNGSGKTTLLRILCGLLLPDDGNVLWKGEPIRELAEDYAKHLLYLGHRPGIKEELTAVENLRIASTLDGQPIKESVAWNALQQMGLKGFEDLPAKVLSQGQKRRVALTRLLISDAPLWILDEPFTALDKVAVLSLQGIIRKHLDNGGMVILTTHQEVELSSGGIYHLQLGKRGAQG